MIDRSSKQYWNDRVLEFKDNERDMIWSSSHAFRDYYESIMVQVLSLYKDCKVIDVACGFGRFCTIFKPENYLGFDFSEEMIKLAKEKYPDYKFEVGDYHTFEVPKVDVIFNVISVGNLGVTHYQFVEKYKDFATKAIISIDGTDIFIHPIYENN